MFVSLQLAAVLAAGRGDSTDPSRLPEVSDIGGPKMAHPQLVPISNLDPGSYTITALTTDEFEGTGSATAVAGAPTLTTVKATTLSPQSP